MSLATRNNPAKIFGCTWSKSASKEATKGKEKKIKTTFFSWNPPNLMKTPPKRPNTFETSRNKDHCIVCTVCTSHSKTILKPRADKVKIVTLCRPVFILWNEARNVNCTGAISEVFEIYQVRFCSKQCERGTCRHLSLKTSKPFVFLGRFVMECGLAPQKCMP